MKLLLCVAAMLVHTLMPSPAAAQAPDRISIVEVYGHNRVSEAAVRAALGMRDGDPMPTGPTGARERLLALPGIDTVDLNVICCASDGGAIIYVGVSETGADRRPHRPAPQGGVRLPQAAAELGAAFERALIAAVQRGAAAEDHSQGHALMEDGAARALQLRMVDVAAAELPRLRTVLRESADPAHRALAAQLLAYHTDKGAIVPDLVAALDDPADEVRNNASRALGIIARFGQQHADLGISVPVGPFVEMLTSSYWTDRNKAAAALLAMTDSREAAVLETLRGDALDALIEMATWRHAGHALPAFIVVARVAGIDDDLAVAAFTAGERDAVFDAARTRTASSIDAADQAPAVAAGGDTARAVQTEQWYFWTDDRIRHYALDIGPASAAANTVVVLHGGWGAEHSYLIDAVAPLADRYRFVLYDQRGSLRTPAPDSTIRIDRLVADLDHLRGSLGLEQMTLVAHSMGNALAYAYLAQHPARVRGLVLVAPVLPTTFASGSDAAFLREVAPDADPAAIAAATDSFMRDAAMRAHAIFQREGLIPDSLQHVPPLELDLLGALRDRDRTRAWRIGFTTVNTCDGSNWRDMRGGMVYYSQRVASAIMEATFAQRAARFWPALQEFAGPVRVVIGTCDFVDIGPSIWPHVVPALNDGAIEIIDGGGHNSWMDRPADFTSALDRALRDIAGRR